MSAVMLQRDPKNSKEWAPVAGWGRALANTEDKDPIPLLELRALQEGLKKLALHAAHCQKLTIWVSREAQALYKLSHRAHPALQAMLIDLA